MNIKIFCTNTGEYLDVAGGSTLAQIATAIEPGLGFKPICARVNNKTEGMGFAVYMPKTIEFQDRTTGSGPRVYARSLCMLLYSALQDVLPDTRLRIEHSISHGYYCRLARRVQDDDAGHEEADRGSVCALERGG